MAAGWRSKWLDWEPTNKNTPQTPPAKLTELTKSSADIKKRDSVNSVPPFWRKSEIISTTLTKLTKSNPVNSVNSVNYVWGETRIILSPDPDPTAWQVDFYQWRAQNCICSEGRDDSGSIRFLHRDFCDWAIAHRSVPCTYPIFERLLADAGFELRDGMVLGLVLRCDYENVRDWRPAPAAPEVPEEPEEPTYCGVKRTPASTYTFSFDESGQPRMPDGVRLLHWAPKIAPVRLPQGSTVLDVERFIAMTFEQLDAELLGQTWQSGNWGWSALLDRLSAVGVGVEIDDPRRARA